jgi:hypothetical protein
MRAASFGSWFGFVESQSGLTAGETNAYDAIRPFLEALETTEMSKSYKMVVLLAMLNQGRLPGMMTLTDLADEITALGRRDPGIGADLGAAFYNVRDLRRLLRTNPIEAWIGGRGTGGARYFTYENEQFRSEVTVPIELIGPAQELIREIVDWRLAEYFARPGKTEARDIVIKVNHASGSPILFPLDRNTHEDLPEGWTHVTVNDEVMRANFVKAAVNVVRRPNTDENVLPQILRQWFGEDAGKPGTRHQVMLKRDGDEWRLQPLGVNIEGAVSFRRYQRAAIAPLYGLPYSERYWGQGFVRQGQHTFLFVTLDKTGQLEAFRYKDRFLSPTEFEWQSQNRTTQEGNDGKSIRDHLKQGITVHLFVRAKGKTRDGKGESFLYCGPVEFASWAGEKPITVVWKLTTPVPMALWSELSIAEEDSRK